MKGAQESHIFPKSGDCCVQQDQRFTSAFATFCTKFKKNEKGKKSIVDCIIYCNYCALLLMWKWPEMNCIILQSSEQSETELDEPI